MKIAILGAGNVGRTLGKVWASRGHEILYGRRQPDPGQLTETTVREATRDGDVLVLTTPWGAAQETLAGASTLMGKILLDCTNPLLPGLGGLEVGHNTSGAECVAQWAPGARVVKIFNTVGYNIMANPVFGNERASMLFCGDDPEAKRVAAGLAEDAGFEPVDAGPLTQARLLEPFALLWITMALKHGHGRDMAFRLLRR
jgi:predicted dinucleotide-binding enzyme